VYPCSCVRPHVYSHNQLSDATDGLYYLHSRNIVHGDLMGVRGCSTPCFTTTLTRVQSKVLVDAAGYARIVDFDCSTITQGPDSTQSASDAIGHTAQWAAPKIAWGGGTYSKEDVFPFAMDMIEVRHEWVICVDPRLTIISYYQRYLPAQLRSMIVHLLRLWRQKWVASTRLNRPIRFSQTSCGY